MLGETLLNSGDPRGAEQAYRMALRRQADNPDAIRGLVGALAAQGRGDEALSFANQLNAEQQAKAGGINKLRGEAQAAQARAAEARGDLGTARSLFEDALLNNPDDAWMRLDLARIYVRQGAVGNARSMMDGLLAAHPDMTDALYASALLSAETQDWATGLSQLERIPVAQRTTAMTAAATSLVGSYAGRPREPDVARRADATSRSDPASRYAHCPGQPGTDRRAGVVVFAGGRHHARVVAGARRDGRRARRYRFAAAIRRHPDGRSCYRGTNESAAGSRTEHGHAAARGVATHAAATHRLQQPEHRHRGEAGRYRAPARRSGQRLRRDRALAFRHARQPRSARPRWPVCTPPPATTAARSRVIARRWRDVPTTSTCRLRRLAPRPARRNFRLPRQRRIRRCATAPDDPRVLAATGRMYHAEGKLSLASRYLQQALIAANTPVRQTARAAGQGAQPNVPRGWESAMQRIGSMPLPGTNPFEGKTAVDTSASASGAPTGPLSGLFSRSTTPMPGLPNGSSNGSSTYPQPSSPTQNVPNYLPPPQPAPYSTPYVAPYSTPGNVGRPVAAGGGYGPDTYGSSQSGGPAAAPLQPYPGQAPAQISRTISRSSAGSISAAGLSATVSAAISAALSGAESDSNIQQPYQQQQPYPAQYQQAQQPYDPAVSSPWPMSPAAREAQANAQQPQPRAYSSAPAAKSKHTSTRKQATSRNTRQADETDYRQQPYPQQQQQYAQQGYGYPQQQQQQPYANQGYGQPYIPQPPAGYGSYPPAQTAQAYSGMAGNNPTTVANAQTLGVADELAQINRAQSSTVSGGIIFRQRTGEDGLSNLTDIEAPVQGRIAAGNGHIVVTATPVTLDAGTATNDPNTLARFGAGLAGGLTGQNNYGDQTASGVGLSVGYETNSVKPMSGEHRSVSVRITWSAALQYNGGITDKVSYSLAVARRAVTDSLLSYAGTRDSSLNNLNAAAIAALSKSPLNSTIATELSQQGTLTWGGVTSNGGRATLGWDDGMSGAT